tara:strand:- start:144 stop:467 length:324 start_codon:yes stop_codon:yes gene_type:complete
MADHDYAEDYIYDASEAPAYNFPICKIVAAKDMKGGDIAFTNSGQAKGIQCCILVSKVIVGEAHPEITELDGLMICDLEGTPAFMPDKIGLRHDTKVGVVRGENHRF